MEHRTSKFLLTSLLGGLVVLLPTVILIAVVIWAINLVLHVISPLTALLVARNMHESFANLFVLSMLLLLCIGVGVFVRTSAGAMLLQLIEKKYLRMTPGYSMVRDTVRAFLGEKKNPFSTVALVRLFDSETMTTAFVVDEHENGYCTVFVPTGPNPTSGMIYHLKKTQVFPIAVKVEDAMRSIISCGAGSKQLLVAYASNLRDGDEGSC